MNEDEIDEKSILSTIGKVADAAVTFIYRKFRTAILIGVGLSAVILFLMSFLSLSPVESMQESASAFFDGIFGDGASENMPDEYEKYLYDPQVVLDNIDSFMDLLDENDDSYTYMTKDNIKAIMNAVLDYREDQSATSSDGYKYYYHQYDVNVSYAYVSKGGGGTHASDITASGDKSSTVHEMAEIITGSTTLPDGTKADIVTRYESWDTEETDREAHTTNHSPTDDPLFEVTWEEIYALAGIMSLVQDGSEGNWEDNLVDEGDGETKAIRTESRFTQEEIDELISYFVFNVVYNFDPIRDGIDMYEYEEMEDKAYTESEEGVNVEHGTEILGTTDPFRYAKYKVPTVAPAYAVNSYMLIEYVYDSANTLDGRMVTIDGQAFYDACVAIIGKDFDLDWYVESVKELPGAYYDKGSGSLADRMDLILESYNSGQPYTYFDDNIPFVGSLKLGDNLTPILYDASVNNGLFADTSTFSLTGPAYQPIECGNEIVQYAQQFLGNPYVWGGASLTNGADCSGFVMSVYQKFGYSLPHKAALIAAQCGPVSINDAQPGDLLFRVENGEVKHVCILIGVENGEYITVEAMGAAYGICIGHRSISRGDLYIGRLGAP